MVFLIKSTTELQVVQIIAIKSLTTKGLTLIFLYFLTFDLKYLKVYFLMVIPKEFMLRLIL